LRRVIIVCNHAHPASSALSPPIWSSIQDRTLEAMRTQGLSEELIMTLRDALKQ
jgi:hypothetical protein